MNYYFKTILKFVCLVLKFILSLVLKFVLKQSLKQTLKQTSFFKLEMDAWFTPDYRDTRSNSHRKHTVRTVLNRTSDKIERISNAWPNRLHEKANACKIGRKWYAGQNRTHEKIVLKSHAWPNRTEIVRVTKSYGNRRRDQIVRNRNCDKIVRKSNACKKIVPKS